jgi:hypothetical protein
VKLSFYRFWLEAFSMPLPSIWHNSGTRVQIRGLEHLQQALHNRKGAILWEAIRLEENFLQSKYCIKMVFPYARSTAKTTLAVSFALPRELGTPLHDQALFR